MADRKVMRTTRHRSLAVGGAVLVVLVVGCGAPPSHAARPVTVLAPPTTTVECQDHTLPCAGPTTTVTTPVLDPAHKDETVIDHAISELTRTPPRHSTLPRTG